VNARTTAIIASRLLGLLLLMFGAAQLLGQVLPFLSFMDWIGWDPRAIFANLTGAGQHGLSANLIGLAVASLAMGHYLLFRGRKVHGWLTAGLGPECGKCGYTLQGVTGEKCPECGTPRGA
jgi:hypothetical protein